MTTAGWQTPGTCRQTPVATIASTHQAVAKTPRRPIACNGGMVSAASLTSASLKMKTTTDADIRTTPRVAPVTCPSFVARHLRPVTCRRTSSG
jgi:hypothetical protein